MRSVSTHGSTSSVRDANEPSSDERVVKRREYIDPTLGDSAYHCAV
jgi:hypothetical protein